MEAEKKPVAKPRKKQTQASDELGPPPPLPTHRMFKPFTDQEISSVIAKAPDAINSEIGGTSSFQLSPEKINEIDKVDDESSTSISENKEDNGLKVEIDHDYEDIVEPEVSEKPITPTARVTEKPLTVLLPKEASPPPLPPRQVYPKLTSISSPADLFELETTRFQSVLPAVAEPPTFSEVVKYPKIRPDVAESSFIRSSSASLHYFQEAELLTEGQLLDYYQNEQLDLVDDFVDTFNEQQLNPHNALFDLLSMYKDVCEKLQLTSDAKQTTVADLTKINNEVWVIEEKVVNETGRCGDDRAASGSASYKEAKFIAAKIVELKEKLSELSRRELDETFCQEIRARSLALQIQWTVYYEGDNSWNVISDDGDTDNANMLQMNE
uniref:Uncharacterized protein n=1 Tax=Panagrolaimus sp. JU765 TaxID=591449 RepID=A0AC34R301_9BILA